MHVESTAEDQGSEVHSCNSIPVVRVKERSEFPGQVTPSQLQNTQGTKPVPPPCGVLHSADILTSETRGFLLLAGTSLLEAAPGAVAVV